MKTKLFLALLLANASFHAPLMASASDDPAALRADDHALAARRLCQDGGRPQEASDAFSRYFAMRPVRLVGALPTEGELAFYTLALRTYAQLDNAQKIRHQEPYMNLMRWFLWRQQNSAQTLLIMVRDLFLFGNAQDTTVASHLAMRGTDHVEACQANPLGAAIANNFLEKNQDAAYYYHIALQGPLHAFTVHHFRNAANTFGAIRQRQNGISAYKLMFEHVPEEQLCAPDYLNAAGCFLSEGLDNEADAYLKRYYEKECDTPNSLAYRLSAASATKKRDFETAGEYWTLALHDNVTMHFSDHANAATCFTHAGNHERAAYHMKRALDAPDFQASYNAYYDACKAFSTVKDYENALPAAEGFMSLRASVPKTDLVTGDLLLSAMTYSHNRVWDKSTPLWDLILKAKPCAPSTFIWAGVDYYDAGLYLRASNAFLSVSPQDMPLFQKKPGLTNLILMSHVLAGRSDIARELLAKRNPASQQKMKKTKAPRRASVPMSDEQVGELKKSITHTCITNIRTVLSNITPSTHDELNRLHETLQGHLHRAGHLFEHVCTGTLPDDSEHGIVTSSSSSAPMSSSNPFLEIQRLAKDVEELARAYQIQKTAFDRIDAKTRHKTMLAQAVNEQTYIFEPLQSVAAPHAPLKKPARSKARHKEHGGAASSDSSRPYGVSTPAASSVQIQHVSNVEWRMTPTAEKHMKKLKTVRGFQHKFNLFCHEIEMEPWGRRGHAATHASGRAKRLKGYDNVFSRRFAKGERFFYRVELVEGGRVIVTILGLMEHDL